jgi:hypothetical protein
MGNKKSSGRAGHHGSSRSQGRKRRLAWIENVKRGERESSHSKGPSSDYFDGVTREFLDKGKAGMPTVSSTPTQDGVTPETVVCYYQYAENGDDLTVLMVYDPNKATDQGIIKGLTAERGLSISNTYPNSTSDTYPTLADVLPGAPLHVEGQYHVMRDGRGFLDSIEGKTQLPVILDEISRDEAYLGMDLRHVMPLSRNKLAAIIGEYFPPRR